MVLEDAYIFLNRAYIAYISPLSVAPLVALWSSGSGRQFPQKQTSFLFTNKTVGRPQKYSAMELFNFFLIIASKLYVVYVIKT